MAGIPGLILNRGCCRFSALTRFFALAITQPPGEPWMIAIHLPGRGVLGTERVDLAGHSEAGPFFVNISKGRAAGTCLWGSLQCKGVRWG